MLRFYKSCDLSNRFRRERSLYIGRLCGSFSSGQHREGYCPALRTCILEGSETVLENRFTAASEGRAGTQDRQNSDPAVLWRKSRFRFVFGPSPPSTTPCFLSG